MRELNFLTGRIVDAAFRSHSKLAPGLLESVHEAVLERDLIRQGFHVGSQKPISFEREPETDLLRVRGDGVRERLPGRPRRRERGIVGVKSVATLANVHEKQVLTHLRLLDCRVGLLLNFGAPLMKDGIERIVNRY